MKRRIITLYKRLIINIKKPEMLILPGQLSFFFLLTLIPLTALIISILSRINVFGNFKEILLFDNVPNALKNIIDSLANVNRANTNAIVFFISALVLASNGTHSMIIASNKLYNIKDRYYIYRKLKSILMLLVLIGLLFFIFAIPVFGDAIIKLISTITGDLVGNIIVIIYNLLKYPLSILFVFYLVKLLYIMAPDAKMNHKEVNYGALFTSIVWIIVTQGYSLYIEYFSNYSNLYGSLSNLLVLMWWIYILSYIFVLGIGLNVSKYQMEKK